LLAVILIIVGVFAWEMGRLWWNQNAWRRQWRNRRSDDD
jgi:uncharacterized membrane protein YidH (DUF202 family)